MDKQTYLAKVAKSKDALRDFVLTWHPSASLRYRRPMKITALGPEEACDIIRMMVREETESLDVAKAFDSACDVGDVLELGSLFNAAWFQVLESTSCWEINGFLEAVELMEDPPEEE